jgi:hypothetical protein
MSSIQSVRPASPSGNILPAVVVKPPSAPAQTLPTDTVTISDAGLSASRNYLQSAAQLTEDPPQQVRQLAAGGNAQARAFLVREAYSQALFS